MSWLSHSHCTVARITLLISIARNLAESLLNQKVSLILEIVAPELYRLWKYSAPIEFPGSRSAPVLYRKQSGNESYKMAEKKALVILAPGAEEMETVISTDVMRRAKINVTVAGLDSNEPVECSRKIKIVPDMSLDEAIKGGPYDVVVLPGGLGGAKRLSESEKVKQVLQQQEAGNRYVAAVCAAPTALLSHGIAKGKQLTSHPVVKQQLEESGNYSYSEARVCRDGTTITSQGPGTCFEFALGIVEAVVGAEVAKEIAGPMILPQ